MFADLKRLGAETLVYGLSTVVGRLLNFLLVPFYSHILTQAENGVVATVFSYVAFLNVLYQHGMDQAYLRHASVPSPGEPEESFSASMWHLSAAAGALSALLWALSGPASSAMGLDPALSDLPAIAAGILALDALSIVPFAELRRSHRAWAYGGIRTANIAVNLALNVALVWGLGMGVRGVFLASLAASAANLVLLAPVLVRHWKPRLKAALHADLVRFAAPFVPSGLASMVVQVADRPILKALTDDATVGVYQINYKLGIFMMLVVNMFDAAWRPFFLEREGRPGSRELFGRVLTYFLLGGTWIVWALSLFIGDLVRIPVLGRPVIHPDFWTGLPVVPIVLAAYLLNGVYVNFMAQVTLTKRTDLLMWATGLGAAVNLAANFALIPRWGMMGAAWATLLAYAAMAGCLFVLGQRLYPIPYEWGRVGHILFALSACACGLWALRSGLDLDGTPWAWGAARALAVLGMPALLWATGFFDEGERQAARRLLFRASRAG